MLVGTTREFHLSRICNLGGPSANAAENLRWSCEERSAALDVATGHHFGLPLWLHLTVWISRPWPEDNVLLRTNIIKNHKRYSSATVHFIVADIAVLHFNKAVALAWTINVKIFLYFQWLSEVWSTDINNLKRSLRKDSGKFWYKFYVIDEKFESINFFEGFYIFFI